LESRFREPLIANVRTADGSPIVSNTTDNTPDGWKIDLRADGWALRWRPPLSGVVSGFPSLYGLIPSCGTRQWVQGLLILPWYAGELASLAGYDIDEQAPRLSVAIFLVAAWAIWDLMLNNERRVIVTNNSVRLWGSAYHVACLATACIVGRWADRSRHKVLFTSNSGATVNVVGWPGVSESTARAISEALIQRACASSCDEEVRTKQCSGLAIKSGGMDNQLVASR
jgi:hypothetical protein